jgi:hypothetical protein
MMRINFQCVNGDIDIAVISSPSRTHLRKRTVRYCPIITVPSRNSLAKMVMIAPLNKSLMIVLRSFGVLLLEYANMSLD